MLTRLGRLDDHELIMQVQEYYADYLAINEDFFHLGIENSLILASPLSRTLESGQIFERNLNGILSVLLSLKRRPSQIRYQTTSDLARRMASDLVTHIEKEVGLFDFRVRHKEDCPDWRWCRMTETSESARKTLRSMSPTLMSSSVMRTSFVSMATSATASLATGGGASSDDGPPW